MSYKNVQSKFAGQDNLVTTEKKVKLLGLVESAKKNDLKSFKVYLWQNSALLNEEITFDITGGEICTLFEWVCAETTNMDIIRFCLENKADPNFQKGLSPTPFLYFCDRRDFTIIWKQSDVLQLFFEHGANPNVKYTDEKRSVNPFFAFFSRILTILTCEDHLSRQHHVIDALPHNLPQIVEIFLKNNADPMLALYENMTVKDILYDIHCCVNHAYFMEDGELIVNPKTFYNTFDKEIRENFTRKFNEKFEETMQKIKEHEEMQIISGIHVKPLSESIDPNQQEQQNVKEVVISEDVKSLNLSDPEVTKFFLFNYKTPSERLSELHEEVKLIESQRGSLHSNSGIYHF